MTALAAPRDVARYGDQAMPDLLEGLQKGSTTLYQGALAVFSAGYLAPGSTATGLTAAGIALRTTANAGADGANGKIAVRRGVFPFKSAGSGDQLAQADCGTDVYIVDDQLVGKTSATGTRSKAGRLLFVDGTDFYVAVGIGVGDQALSAQAAIADLTMGTNVTAATANGSLEDSAATNPSDTNFNNNMKEIGTKINAMLAALRASNILLT